MPTTTANGIRIAYEIEGPWDGVPLLLIPGYGQQLVSWPRGLLTGLFERGFRVIRMDNRDSGASTMFDAFGAPPVRPMAMGALFGLRPSAPYRLEDMADDAASLIDALEIPAAHIVGASMGGAIAQLVAARHPKRTLTLTSIMATSGRRFLSLPKPLAVEALFQIPASSDVEDLVDHYVEMYRRIGSPMFPTDEAELRQTAREMYARGFEPRAMARQFAAMLASGSDRVPLLKKLRVSTLVVHGSEDPLVPPDHGQDVAQLVPGARFELIEGMGHDLPPGVWTRLTGLLAAHCRAVPVTPLAAASGGFQ